LRRIKEMIMDYARGTVWWVELPLNVHSHVQGGTRPCLIVSNPIERSGVITVCPLSTRIDNIPTHTSVNVKKEGQVLVEQITTVDISSLGDYAGVVSDSDMEKVDEVIRNLFLGNNKFENEPINVSIEDKLNNITRMLEYLIQKEEHNEKDV
jgi:mRNA-degrading endonuclease toxin of MazEF toxin-antitoxin module